MLSRLRPKCCFPYGWVSSSYSALHEGERTLGAEEFARDVEGFAADNDNLLAVKELLGDDASKSAEQVALAIDDDLLGDRVSAPRSSLQDIVSSQSRAIRMPALNIPLSVKAPSSTGILPPRH